MLEPIETIDYKGYTIEICVDEIPSSPLEWDNLGTMVCFHRGYNLGDEHEYKSENFESWDEILDQIETDHGTVIALPLYLYDHSGITIATYVSPFWQHASWDSMRVGWIYVTKEKVKSDYGCKRFSPKMCKQIEAYLTHEVEIYADFISGQTYGYVVKGRDDEEIDDCWGYFGHDWDENGLMESAKCAIDYEVKNTPELIFCS